MSLKAMIPVPLKALARRALNVVLDQADLLMGRRDPMIPPRNRIYVGDGDFRAIGEEFVDLFRDLGKLQTRARVLDVGSGIGRLAAPLTRYLDSEAEYLGLEIVEDGVRWCERRITPRAPNFRFVHADIHNEMYNPGGRFQASDYKFPFKDAQFDFVFLISVFTHMLPRDVAHYLEEIARVLRPGGRCFATFFLLTPESEQHIQAGRSSLPFRVRGTGYKSISEETPERAVAFDEAWVKQAHESVGLHIEAPIHYGSWCGRERYTTFQDIVLSRKSA
jgi:SAM-dependent methyltransferase